MFELETFSDYSLLNDELISAVESARPYEFSEYGAGELYADEVEEKIWEIIGSFDASDCGADEETLSDLRDRLESCADELDHADDICDDIHISITWDIDALDFYQENRGECDEALEEYYGGPSGTDCDTAMDVIVTAAHCGMDAIVRSAAHEWTNNLESEIRAMIEDIDKLIYESDED